MSREAKVLEEEGRRAARPRPRVFYVASRLTGDRVTGVPADLSRNVGAQVHIVFEPGGGVSVDRIMYVAEAEQLIAALTSAVEYARGDGDAT